MQFNIIHRPIGGMDSDTDDSAIQPEDYRDALNIRNATTYIGKEGSLSNLKGNTIVSYNLGGVKHKCIGSVEDKANNGIIYFLWAKDSKHKILRYNYLLGNIELLMTYNFGWKYKTFIQADIVDSKLLYWIDPNPRKLNIQKASLVDKKKTWKLYVPKTFDNGGAIITFTIKDMVGAVVDTLVVSISAGSRALTLSSIKSLLDANLSDYISTELCDDCDLEITETAVNSYVLSVSEQQILIVPDNWYGNVSYATAVSDRIFHRGKFPPCYSPSATYKKDTTKNYNFVKNRVFQFRLQYHYDDNEDSSLSPISKIPQGASCTQIGQYNYIEVDFSQPDLFSAINLTILKQVSVLVREHNEGDWIKVVTLNPCDFYRWSSGAKMIYDFYNDVSTTNVPSVLANKQYDKLGIEIGASKFVKDRIIDGNIVDDYDIDKCIDMDVTTVIDDVTQKKLYKVSGNIYIYSYRMDDSEATSSGLFLGGRTYNEPTGTELNGLILYDSSKAEDDTYKWTHYGGGNFGHGAGFDFKVNQGVIDAYDQRLPEGGFVVYSAGTDYYTISRQKEFGLVKNELGALDYADTAKTDAIANAFKYSTIYPNKKAGSIFELYLPEGTHVIRLASHWCSVGDKLGKGNHYDLNSNLYQKTSTNVWGTYDNAGVWKGGVREIEVTITNSDVYLGDFVVKDLTPSDDMDSAPHPVKFTNICGYLVDDKGRVDPNSDTFNPVPVELAYIGAVSMNDPAVGSSKYHYELDNGFTDHNGYFFLTLMEYLTDSSMEAFYLYASQVKNVVGLPLQYNNYFAPISVGAGTGATTIKTTIATNDTTIKDFESTYWEGNLSDMYNHTLTPFGYKNTASYFPDFLGLQANRTYNVILTTDTADARNKCSTLVKGNVNKAEGITVLSTRGGMTKTDSNGDYSLVVWGDMMYFFDGFDLTVTGHSSGTVNLGYSKWKQNDNRVDKLIFINNTTCDLAFSASTLNYNVTQFDANALVQSNTPPYSPTSTLLMTTVNLTAGTTTNIKGWKRGSWRYVGIRYYDEMNRSSSVLANEKTKLYIPFVTEDLGSGTYKYGRAKINVVINHNAPTWAKYFQLLVTDDRYYSNYLQFRINSVKEDNDYLKIDLDNLTTYATKNKGSQLAYTFNEGDKLRMIFNREGTYYNGLYEFDILSWEAPNTVIIRKPSIDIKSGSLIEVYSTKLITNENIYYEIGEVYAVNAGGVHSSTNITIEGGDSYWRLRKIPVNDIGYNGVLPVIVEDRAISDFFSSTDQDYGRVGIEDEKYGRVNRKTIIRISNTYIPNSKINGLSNNENVDDKEMGINYGSIRKIIYVGDVALAVCDNKVVANYIGHVVAKSAETGLLSTTSEFIGDTRPLVGDYGTQDAISIQEFNGFAYGFDALRGIVWRYGTNGLDDIRIKTKTIFNGYVGKKIYQIASGYDVKYQQYLLSLYEQIDETHPYSGGSTTTTLSITYSGANPTILTVGDYVEFTIILDDGITTETGSGYVTLVSSGNINIAVNVSISIYDPDNVVEVKCWFAGNKNTYAWSESKNRWESRYSFYPEQMERVNQELVTFKDGALYIHDRNALRNNFHGVQGKTSLQIVPNQDDIIKIWMAVYLQQYQENKLNNWSIPVITNQKQLSRIKNGSFKKKEEFWHSDFKRDMNSNGGAVDSILNGKPLRSQNIVVTLENDYTGDMDLDTVNFTIVKSDKNT